MRNRALQKHSQILGRGRRRALLLGAVCVAAAGCLIDPETVIVSFDAEPVPDTDVSDPVRGEVSEPMLPVDGAGLDAEVGPADGSSLDVGLDRGLLPDVLADIPDAVPPDVLPDVQPDAWPPANHGCEIDLPFVRDLTDFYVLSDRWQVDPFGRIVALPLGDGVRNGALLRHWGESCTDMAATLTFMHSASQFPLLLTRVGGPPDFAWYGVGYNGFDRSLGAWSGGGTMLSVVIGEPDFVDLEADRLYTLQAFVVDDTVTGLLFEEGGLQPIAITSGGLIDEPVPGPGRIGVLEAGGGEAEFRNLRVEPIRREGDGEPTCVGARVVSPTEIELAMAPRQDLPLVITEGDAAGLQLELDGVPAPIESVSLREGSNSELVVRTGERMVGGQEVVLRYGEEGVGEAPAGRIADADDRSLHSFSEVADNLLHDEPNFDAVVDNFERETLGDHWVAAVPEAMTLRDGELIAAPVDAFGLGAWLRRPMHECHVDSRATADFNYISTPMRNADRVEVIATLRMRTFGEMYQGVFWTRGGDAGLMIRRYVGGRLTVLAGVLIDPIQVAPGIPLRLRLSASGTLLWVEMFRLDDPGQPVLLSEVYATDTAIWQPGAAGLALAYNGVAYIESFRVEPPEPPHPRIEAARVPVDRPNVVELDILSACRLVGLDPAGFAVRVPEPRIITDVVSTPDGLELEISGPPVQQGQRITLAYDQAAGTITDTCDPEPQPLASVAGLVVDNQAPPGDALIMTHGQVVTRDVLDVEVTDTGALPVHTAGAALQDFSVRLSGRRALVLAIHPVKDRDHIIRLTFDGIATPNDHVTIAYNGGEVGSITDQDGMELQRFGRTVLDNWLVAIPPVVPQFDNFERDNHPIVGEGWEERQPALWSIEDGSMCYTPLPEAEGIDQRSLRPLGLEPIVYTVSARMMAPSFDPDVAEPVAFVVGTAVVDQPQNPYDGFNLAAGFNFRRQRLMLLGAGNSVAASTSLVDNFVEPDQWVRLQLNVNGRSVVGELFDDAGELLARVPWFMPFPPVHGRVGVAGGGTGTVCFDDFTVGAVEGPPPRMQVMSTTISSSRQNAVRVELQTGTDTIRTLGVPDGWSVTVDDQSREVLWVERVANLLLVHFGGPAVAARHIVTIRYDHRLGDVHDNDVPVPNPLDSFGPRDVANQAGIGAELFVLRTEVVAPCCIDLVLNSQAELPAELEAGVGGFPALSLTSSGRPLAIRQVRSLPLRDDRIRLQMAEPLSHEDDIAFVYTPGIDHGRLLTAGGQELSPPYEMAVVNHLTAPTMFPPFSDDFERPGIDVRNNWTVEPRADWRLSNGAVTYMRATGINDPFVVHAPPVMTGDVAVELEFSVAPRSADPNDFVAAGGVLRVTETGGYRSWYALGTNGNPALVIERVGSRQPLRLANTPMEALMSGVHYVFEFRAVGQTLVSEIRRDDEVMARALAVDPMPPLQPGLAGMAAVGLSPAQFYAAIIRPPGDQPARVVVSKATVYEYKPHTLNLDISSVEPLLHADSVGFHVQVNGEEREVQGIVDAQGQPVPAATFDPSAGVWTLQLVIGGEPIGIDDAVLVDYDPMEGMVMDGSAVPEPLGGFVDLPVVLRSPPLLAAVSPLGPNIFEVEFNVQDPPLELEGLGGLEAWVRDGDPDEEPVRYGVTTVWPDPHGGNTTFRLATDDVISIGAELELRMNPQPGNQILDSNNELPAPFETESIAPIARTIQHVERQTRYSTSWFREIGDVGWTYFPESRWIRFEVPNDNPVAELEEEYIDEDGNPQVRIEDINGYVYALRNPIPEVPTEAIAPPFVSGGSMEVSVDFQIRRNVNNRELPAFPRVLVHSFNASHWIGCYIRNTINLLPGGGQDEVDDFSPSFNCAAQLPNQPERFYYNECRFQFYETGGVVRYDWEVNMYDEHRMVVRVHDQRLRGELRNLNLERFPDQPDEGELVAVVELPTVDMSFPPYRSPVGMPGLATFDSGVVGFQNFRVRPLRDEGFPELGTRWEASGNCN